MLERRFGVPLVVVVRSHTQLAHRRRRCPDRIRQASPDTYHSDTLFLKAPLTAKQAMKVVELREGVDQAWPGRGVLYFSRLSALRTKSRMSRIVGDAGVQADDDQKLDDDDEVARACSTTLIPGAGIGDRNAVRRFFGGAVDSGHRRSLRSCGVGTVPTPD